MGPNMHARSSPPRIPPRRRRGQRCWRRCARWRGRSRCQYCSRTCGAASSACYRRVPPPPSPPSLPYNVDTSRPSLRTNWTRCPPPSPPKAGGPCPRRAPRITRGARGRGRRAPRRSKTCSRRCWSSARSYTSSSRGETSPTTSMPPPLSRCAPAPPLRPGDGSSQQTPRRTVAKRFCFWRRFVVGGRAPALLPYS